MCRPRHFRHAVVPVVALASLVLLWTASVARAQRTPDPYNIVGDYNLGYESYMYSNYPNGIGYTPNQGILQGRQGYNRANQFSNYIQELDGVGSDSDGLFGFGARGRGAAEPYYRAHRQFDEAFNRVYVPNDAADKVYTKDQQARTDKYLEYLREPDPRKRAQLYREYTQQNLRAARDFGSASARGASARATPSTASPATPPTSRPTTRAWANPVRRPSTSGSSPLAPAGRTRAGAGSSTTTAPGTSETPQQILQRAELIDRANRATSAAPSPTPTPSSTPAPR